MSFFRNIHMQGIPLSHFQVGGENQKVEGKDLRLEEG